MKSLFFLGTLIYSLSSLADFDAFYCKGHFMIYGTKANTEFTLQFTAEDKAQVKGHAWQFYRDEKFDIEAEAQCEGLVCEISKSSNSHNILKTVHIKLVPTSRAQSIDLMYTKENVTNKIGQLDCKVVIAE